MDIPFPEEHLQQKCFGIIKETLQEKSIKLSISNFELREENNDGTYVSCKCTLNKKNIII